MVHPSFGAGSKTWIAGGRGPALRVVDPFRSPFVPDILRCESGLANVWSGGTQSPLGGAPVGVAGKGCGMPGRFTKFCAGSLYARVVDLRVDGTLLRHFLKCCKENL
jgi:hypothetical protein